MKNSKVVSNIKNINSYLKIAFRQLVKQKTFHIINVFGLSLGLSACLLLFMFVRYELSFDKEQPNSENSYRVSINFPDIDFGGSGLATTPAKLLSVLNEELGQVIENSTHFSTTSSYWSFYKDNEKVHGLYSSAAMGNITKFFDLKLKVGDNFLHLDEPNKVYLSENAAYQIFGGLDVLDKTLLFNKKVLVTVAGVFQNLPKNTHAKFDVLYSKSTLEKESPALFGELENNFFYTFIQLRDRVPVREVERKITALYKSRTGRNIEVTLQRISDIHLSSNLIGEMQKNGSSLTVSLCFILMVFLLVISCFNFVNSSIARVGRRAKEVGTRKYCGASNLQIMLQFVVENIVFVMLSVFLALLMLHVTIPWFERITNQNIEVLFESKEVLTILISVLVIAILSGLVPFVFLSSFKLTSMLSGEVSHGATFTILRRSLVAFQGMVAAVLISVVVAMVLQMTSLKNIDVGYDYDSVIVIPDISTIDLKRNFEVFERELEKAGNIDFVSSGEQIPTMPFNMMRNINIHDTGEVLTSVPLVGVNYNYLSSLKIKLLAGRDFSSKHAADHLRIDKATGVVYVGVIINKAAAEAAGWSKPSDAIGKRWGIQGSTPIVGTVVGVIEDIKFVSPSEPTQPMFLSLGLFTQGLNHITISVKSKGMQNSLLAVTKTFESVFGTSNPQVYLLSDKFGSLYDNETSQVNIVILFTLLVLSLTCFGLFGLATFTVERRSKEIAIRRILGASLREIYSLLFKEFTVMLSVSSILAVPIAFSLINFWLDSFSTRINIEAWWFAFSCSLIIVISYVTVILTSHKVTNSNPAEVLKNS